MRRIYAVETAPWSKGHVRVLLLFQQPTFQQITRINDISAAHVVISFVASDIMNAGR